jgi:hypothetical protein
MKRLIPNMLAAIGAITAAAGGQSGLLAQQQETRMGQARHSVWNQIPKELVACFNILTARAVIVIVDDAQSAILLMSMRSLDFLVEGSTRTQSG